MERTKNEKLYVWFRLEDDRKLTIDSIKQRLSNAKHKLLTFGLILATLLYLYVNVASIETHTKWKLNEAVKRTAFKRVDEFCRRMRENKSICELPLHVNPFDEFVKPYIHPDKLNCEKKAPLTYVDYDNALLLYTKEGHNSGFTCYYAWLYRFTDLYSNESNYKLLPKSGVMFSNQNYIAKVQCYGSAKRKVSRATYLNVHLWIPDYEKTNATGPSVFIFVVESLSRLSFHRFMNKTNAVMKLLKDFTILEGVVKVGLNSFPNSMALLTGDVVKNYSYTKDYWDNKYDYIWKPFKRKGYVTAFVEDFVLIGLFNYLKKGFQTPPTDFYPIPFWLQTFAKNPKSYDDLMSNKSHFCFESHGSKAELFLEQTFQFARKMFIRHQPYFMYASMIQLTHQDINNFYYIDEDVAYFILQMSNYLSNTIFIIMGDHGPRYGSYIDTPMGILEGRLPFFAIRIPEQLNEKYPHLRKVAELNKQNMLSWFDIHQLLLDITRDKYEFEEKTILKPLNPLRHLVSPKRTCEDALIEKPYCVCNGKFEVDEWDMRSRVDAAILHFTVIVKKWISYYFLILPSCVKLEDLNKTLNGEIMLPNCNETFLSVERLNVTISLTDTGDSISAVIQRRMLNVNNRKWSNWTIDYKYVNVTQLKEKVKKIFCRRESH